MRLENQPKHINSCSREVIFSNFAGEGQSFTRVTKGAEAILAASRSESARHNSFAGREVGNPSHGRNRLPELIWQAKQVNSRVTELGETKCR